MQIEIGWYFKWLVFERSVPLVLSMQSSISSAGGFWFVLLLVDTVLPAGHVRAPSSPLPHTRLEKQQSEP